MGGASRHLLRHPSFGGLVRGCQPVQSDWGPASVSVFSRAEHRKAQRNAP